MLNLAEPRTCSMNGIDTLARVRAHAQTQERKESEGREMMNRSPWPRNTHRKLDNRDGHMRV